MQKGSATATPSPAQALSQLTVSAVSGCAAPARRPAPQQKKARKLFLLLKPLAGSPPSVVAYDGTHTKLQ